MAGASTAGKHIMLNALARGTAPPSQITHVSLHSADPGDTGASELTGGSPAYARKPIAFNAAAAGAADDSTNGVAFDVPAATVAYAGFWSALTAGTFLWGAPLSATEVYTAQGVYNLTDADLILT